jgi:hypothetical protein
VVIVLGIATAALCLYPEISSFLTEAGVHG